MPTYKIDQHAKYAKSHEWVRVEEGLAVVGISDAAQDLLSDVVYVDLPAEGRKVKAGESVAVVESVKAAEEVYAPVSGTVVTVNDEVVDKPETVNAQPYAAWFFKLQPDADLDSELAALMTPAAYEEHAAASAH